MRIPFLFALGLVAAACASPAPEPVVKTAHNSATAPAGSSKAGLPSSAATGDPTSVVGPRLRVLGIAQDGGLPHAGCSCTRCEAAVSDPGRASGATSVAIIDEDKTFLLDASPDLPHQLRRVADVGAAPAGRVDRKPVDGILLTHAHIGHYLGLAHLGFEVASTAGVDVWASSKMAAFLRDNAPWDQLIRLDNVRVHDTAPAAEVQLTPSITATPTVVPHRGEYTDTFAWTIRGPRRAALYIPDCASWSKWSEAAQALFDVHDLMLVDATFFSGDELSGRAVEDIGHPLVTDSLERLRPRVDAGAEVVFIHLNHSNPALDPASEERRTIVEAGFRVASVGEEFAI